MFDDNEEELYSDEGNDDGFDEDMEALTRACTIAGADINDPEDFYDGGAYSPSAEVTDRDSSGGLEADFELFRKVQSRFSKGDDSSEPISLKALRAIHPDSDNDDDDFQTLCAVRRRFSAYDDSDNARRTMEKTSFENPGGVDIENAVSESDNLNGSSTGRKNCKVFPDSEDTLLSDNMDIVPSSTIEQQLDALELSSLGKKGFSSFPKSAQLFMNAIKKNRSCQKFLQSKLAQIEARMEENKELKERVKILKDFQSKCKNSTSRALGLEKHQYVRLISAQKTENCRDLEVNGKKVSALCYGPVENSHVANYREALKKYPVLFKQKNWTEEERENLKKGIRQQFQEMVLQHSLDEFSGQEGSYGDSSNLDVILSSIRDLEITPERCREFLPKVNWDQLSSLYAVGHTAAECEARWLNIEDPLINHGEWTVEEDKKLLFIVQEKGMTNWFDIAVLHGKNRTPFQCLARFQRSLNARIIKREWTKEEDAQLCIAVETFGDSDWQSVASTLEGRTGSQCSNRWHKSLHPDISRVGRWTPEESIRLKVAVMLFGPKNWRKIAQFVPGRTHVKCRERWFNCEDPSLKRDKWTEDEDLRLKQAIQEQGYCWTKIAKCLAPRTDNQCRRRWMALFPQEVPLLQAVRNTQKAAIISNFVDRESDRPRLGPHDFVPQPLIKSASGSDDVNQSRKRKRNARKEIELGKDKNAPASYTSKRRRSVRLKERMEISNSPIEHDQDNSLSKFRLPWLTCSRVSVDARKKKKPVIREFNKDNAVGTKRRIKPSSGNQDGPLSIPFRVNGIIVYTRRKKKLPVHANELIQEELDYDSRALVPVCTELADNHLHSNYLAGNSISQFNSSGKITKLPFKRKVHMESANNVRGTESGNYSSKGVISKPPKCSRERNSKLLEQDQGIELVHYRPDEHKKLKFRSKSCTKRVLESTEDCDVTLASFLKNRSGPKQVLDPTEDCDVTLASFLQKKRVDEQNAAY